jgi:hypothetical protein
MTDFAGRIVAQQVAAPAARVYAFARRMEKLPSWAAGLAGGVRQEGGAWFAESPMGRVKVEMASENPHGVLDHDVTLPDGAVIHNALRVSPTGPDASLLVFVVPRPPATDDAAFEADVAHVQRDLRALAERVESGADA